MQYGICNLNCVPVRSENSDMSEMVTQLLFGDHFQILETRGSWVRICIAFDYYQGWIDYKQLVEIDESTYQSYSKKPDLFLSDLVGFGINQHTKELVPLSLGANLKAIKLLDLDYDGQVTKPLIKKSAFIQLAINYLNTPYLWGGKTPFGIDCSGLTQMVYKIGGYQLFRDASQQARQGEALSFIEESEPGDLAFFDNDEGQITHVGIIMQDNHIIHAHGKVRIDRLDQTGIYNVNTHKHSHKLRVIKKIF